MQFGAVFPTTEIGDDPVAIRDYAQAAEGLGYSHIGFSEHIVSSIAETFPPALSFDEPWHESFTLLAFLAAAVIAVVGALSALLIRDSDAASTIRRPGSAAALTRSEAGDDRTAATH